MDQEIWYLAACKCFYSFPTVPRCQVHYLQSEDAPECDDT
jgi:hypothetical protein